MLSSAAFQVTAGAGNIARREYTRGPRAGSAPSLSVTADELGISPRAPAGECAEPSREAAVSRGGHPHACALTCGNASRRSSTERGREHARETLSGLGRRASGKVSAGVVHPGSRRRLPPTRSTPESTGNFFSMASSCRLFRAILALKLGGSLGIRSDGDARFGTALLQRLAITFCCVFPCRGSFGGHR